MAAQRLQVVLLVDAVYSVAVGVLLLAGDHARSFPYLMASIRPGGYGPEPPPAPG